MPAHQTQHTIFADKIVKQSCDLMGGVWNRIPSCGRRIKPHG